MGGLVCALLLVVAAAPAGGVVSSTHEFQTGFLDEWFFQSSEVDLGMREVKDAGATNVRLRLDWASVAPGGPVAPQGFDPTDPNDPNYNWSSFDRQVEASVAEGLTPIANIFYPPAWALDEPAAGMAKTVPDVTQFGEFALAAAKRYSGSTPGLPRVKYWEIWNEPNIGLYFQPQFLNGEPYSPTWYRNFVNAASDSLKSVHPDNFVIAGSTAPFYDLTPETLAVNPTWGPMAFTRDVLCLSRQLTPTCHSPVRIDAWSHHPYPQGGPWHKVTLADDVTLAELPNMTAALNAAYADGNIVASAPPALWVDEFAWASLPSGSNGVPMHLLLRWVPESMYEMWSDGVTVLNWYTLVDDAFHAGLYFGGSTFADAQPKPILNAFRFPFVAYPTQTGIRYWGRTPAGRDASVSIEQQQPDGSWSQLGVVQTDQYGIIQGRLGSSTRGQVRARAADLGETSVPFSLRLVPDQSFTPLGLDVQLEPARTYAPRPAIPSRRRP
jgi:hypothetical protein